MPDHLQNPADGHFQQALLQFQQGRLREALASLQQLLTRFPNHANALQLSGIVQAQLGQFGAAILSFSRAIDLDPRQPSCHSNLGYALHREGRLEEASTACQRAIQLKPDFPDAHNMLGVILKDLGRLDEALAACGRAVQLRPGFAEAHQALGVILKDLGRLDEALAACDRALQLRPEFAEAHQALGVILKDLGRPEEALAACDRAIALRPTFAQAHDSRGSLLDELGRISEALGAFERALQLDPRLVTAHYNRANLLANLGRYPDAEAGYRRTLDLQPGHAVAHSNLLFLQAAEARLPPAERLEQQRLWDQRHGAAGRKAALPARTLALDTGRRLRIGYVSPDFRRHSVAYFFEPLLRAHDRDGFEIFCYANHDDRSQSDAVTHRLRQRAEHWRFVRHLDDATLARNIHADGIDILVDLAGHTDGGRLGAFSYRPAPVQAMYLGYCASSGLEAMDYWITDAVLHPQDTDEASSERIHRLPRCSFCYQPPAEAPAVAPCPGLGEQVTFGAFHHLSKLQPEVIATWSRLLLRLPGSRLLVMDRYLDDAGIRQDFLRRFTAQGVAPERLVLRGRLPHAQYLASYGEVDILLDTFPRTGGTTTAEALWMGVPVVTLAGGRYVERISASKLMALGLPELICEDEEAYVETALALARDHDQRQVLRDSLRARMAASPLCDAQGLARAMESAYRTMAMAAASGQG